MKNRVTASLEFYFKGEKYTPSMVLDIDKLLESTDKLPSLYPFLAQENAIDTYSYVYEVMLLEKIKYTRSQGMISNFIDNGELDVEAFERSWKELKVLKSLQTIAQTHLNIDDLEQQQEIKKALLDAYYLGQNHS